ncbi:MAG: SCO family protein [Gammaproteobacteria bacterium]|nr:SCO family protein [Gammaproteobacteria bacterium]
MSSGIRNTILACLAFMALMVGLFVNNMLREPELSDDELREQGIIVLPQPRELEPFELTGSNGEPFTREDLVGQWTFAYFGFTHCPDICPVTLSVMGRARQQLLEAESGKESEAGAFQGIMVSVDPERDTPEVLEEFVTYFSPDFVGVTGSREEIAELAGQVSVAFAAMPDPDAPDGYVVDHTGNIVIINPRGHYHGFIRMPHSADQVVLAYETLRGRM